MNAADSSWVLVSAGLVMFMTPGLALFYSGMIRAKSMLNTIALTVACLGVVAALVHKTLGLRAPRDAELAGIDEEEHAETACDHARFAVHHTALAAPARAASRGSTATPPAA